ncbi:hypothetical protein Tco_0611299 [Tanacetum coccineum]
MEWSNENGGNGNGGEMESRRNGNGGAYGNGNGNGGGNGYITLERSNGGYSHMRTIRIEAAYAMSWAELMKLMTEVYCPRNEIQEMETELWNLAMKGNDLTNIPEDL